MGSMIRSIEALAANINDAIVQVRASGYAPISGAASSRTSLLARRSQTGSGIIVSADGYIITNAHVVAGATRVHVHIPRTDNQRSAQPSPLGPADISVPAEIVGIDSEADIAVLKVERTGLAVVEFGDSGTLETGQLVLAFGSPFGLEGTVTMGVVSAVARQVEEDSPMVYVQTDAAINPGNSGGALVDARGKLVGVNTFIASPSGASNGLGFAVPSNLVKVVYEQIREHGHVRRGIIGVHAQTVKTVTPTLASGPHRRWHLALDCSGIGASCFRTFTLVALPPALAYRWGTSSSASTVSPWKTPVSSTSVFTPGTSAIR